MPKEFTNLLPETRQRALIRDYRLRLGVVAILFGIALTIVAALLLVPSYLFLLQSLHAKEAHLAGLTSTLSASDESLLSKRLVTLSKEADALVALSKEPSPSLLFRSVLAIPNPGVTLSSLVYNPATVRRPAQLVLTGTALTRNALRSYQLALQGAPFARAVDLPVSAYAKDADIAFTVTITLAL